MYVKTVFYTCNGILVYLKKEGNLFTCKNMDEPGGHLLSEIE
jgi:hypothetical protein